MKRAAAIVGPTPPFLRWAIDVACPLLRPSDGRPATEKRNPAQSRWRQVRGFQEVSRAQLQGRTFAGYCFAPQSNEQQILAVRIDEVTAPWGGSAKIEAACAGCPANPAPADGAWATCTGLLPLVPPAASLEETRSRWRQRRESIELAASTGLKANRPHLRWTSTWTGPCLEAERLGWATELLQQDNSLLAEQPVEAAALLNALNHARKTKQRIWIEAVPSGYSDGQTWSLPAHCLACGEEWPPAQPGGSCPACFQAASYQGPKRLKVLGLSPYLRLAEVLGQAAAGELQDQYTAHRKCRESAQ